MLHINEFHNENCKFQIFDFSNFFIYVLFFLILKFNLKVFYPPPYERHIWHYEHANTDMVSKAMEGFDWNNLFLNKDVNEKATILTKTVLNIMSNYIPNEIITIDDKDPDWINNQTKSLIKHKTEYFKNCDKTKCSASIRH